MVASKRREAERKRSLANIGRCGECEHCTPVTRFHTLNVHGEPTIGTCPYWMESKCVLLSQKGCERHFKQRTESIKL